MSANVATTTARVIRAGSSAPVGEPARRASANTVRRISALEINAHACAEALLEDARRRADDETIARRLRELACDEAARVRERALLIDAVRAVSERVIGDALRADDDTLGRWLRDAIGELSRVRAPRSLQIRASDATVARLAAFDLPAGTVRLIVDAQLGDGDVVLTSDVGDAVVSVRWQVDALVNRLATPLDRALAAAMNEPR